VSYTLDPVGNRLAAASTLAGVASSFATYSPDDLLSTESYDLNGNVLSTGGRSFTYDSENRLIAMTGGAAGSQVAIQYDGWGNRVAETINGATTRYLVDDLNPTGYPQVVEELVNGAVSRQYTNGLQRISENQTISGKWTPSFYGYDGMGNVRQLSNLAGTITDNYEYDAFGNMILSTGSTPNNYLYRGEQYDATLGMQYLRARYYNPVTGRFLSKDPWPGTINDPASLHKYSYAESNPIAGRDPSGLSDLVEVNLLANLPKVAGLRYVSSRVNCVFYTAAGTLQAISDAEQSGASLLSVNVDYSNCGGRAGNTNGQRAIRPGESPRQDAQDSEPEANSKDCGGIIVKGAIQSSLDALSIIPGEGTIATGFYGGKEAFQALQFGAGLVSTGISIEGKDGIGVGLGVTGVGWALLSAKNPAAVERYASLIKGGAEAIPYVGSVVGVGATVWDIISTTKDYGECARWW